MIVVDTGPLYAAVDAADAHHAECSRLLLELPEQLLVPVSVVVEAAYLIGSRLDSAAEARFLHGLSSGEMAVEPVHPHDLSRMADLVSTYGDLPLGAVDASVVTVAERVGATTVLTTDRRHFNVVRPAHAAAFTLLP